MTCSDTKVALEGQSDSPYFQLSFRKKSFTGEKLSSYELEYQYALMLAVAREGLVYSLLKFPCGQELSEGVDAKEGTWSLQ